MGVADFAKKSCTAMKAGVGSNDLAQANETGVKMEQQGVGGTTQVDNRKMSGSIGVNPKGVAQQKSQNQEVGRS